MQVSTSVASEHGQTGVKTHSSASDLTRVLNWALWVHTDVFQQAVKLKPYENIGYIVDASPSLS